MGPRYVLRIFWGLNSNGPWKNETYTHLKVEKCVIVKRLRCLLPNIKRWEKLGYGIVVSSFKQASANTVNLHSSILVYHFWKHAYHFCSTWMTSGMHIEKRGGLVISDWFFGEGMETIGAGEKVTKRKEWKNILQKLCVHTVNEQTNKH